MMRRLLVLVLALGLAGSAYANEPSSVAVPAGLRIDRVYPTGRVHWAISGLDPDTVLSGTASTIAGRDVYVVCVKEGDPGYPGDIGAWGYVYLAGDNEYMAEEVCDGLHALIAQDTTVPAWKQALGALVLTHESFHLNQAVKDPGNEARTECRAVKNWARAVGLLGGGDADVERLLPYALAIHWRLAAKVPAYNWEGCRAPNFWPPDP